MSSVLPGSDAFTTAVYGTVFAGRSQAARRLKAGDRLILVPDPPGAMPGMVWVHARGGDVVGHLSADISGWLVSSMLGGSCYRADVSQNLGDDTASWRRLVIVVRRVAEKRRI